MGDEGGRSDQRFLELVELHVARGWSVESFSPSTLRAYVRMAAPRPQRWWRRASWLDQAVGSRRLVALDRQGDIRWKDFGPHDARATADDPLADVLSVPGSVGSHRLR